MAGVISVELALRLRAAGLPWQPASGDRFVIPDRGMDDQVFVVSELTIDVADVPGGRILRFNGTTEWALDSVDADAVVWLPHEGQLRAALGRSFRRLERIDSGVGAAGWAVVVETGGRERREIDTDAERAYARSVLALLGA
jgi:hypothetical protein